MSELKVDKITPRLGTTLTLGDTGDTINFGSGVLPNFENLTVTGDLTVDTNSLYVDSTNNYVGIGTASPSVALDVVGAITATGTVTATSSSGSSTLVINGADLFDSSIFLNDAGSNSYSIFKDGSQSDDFRLLSYGDTAGNTDILRYSKNGSLRFQTAATERVRIDSAGDFMVGTTSEVISDSTGTGTYLDISKGTLQIKASGNIPLVANRVSSDGQIIQFRKDGSTIGAIGNQSVDFHIENASGGGNDTGIALQNNAKINPLYNSSLSNNTIDIGSSSYNFKDAYFGGIVNSADLDVTVGSAGNGLQMTAAGDHYINLGADSNRSGASQSLLQMEGKWNGTAVARMQFVTGTDTTNKDDAEIRFQTASAGTPSTAMTIASNGNVGIGTSSPAERLDVNSDIKGSRFYSRSSTSGSSTNIPVTTQGDGYTITQMRSKGNTTDAVFIEFDGLNPGGSNQSNSWIGAQYNGNWSSNLVFFAGKKTNTAINNYDSAKVAQFNQDAITFNTGTAGASDTSERLRINSAGNVGIGTSSPDQLLHLSAGQGATLRFESTTTGATTGDIFGAIEFETRDSNNAGVRAKIDAYSEGNVGNTALRFFTGTSTLDEVMRIDSGGSVFIGQTSGSAQLEVTATSPENVAEWRNYNNDGRGFAFQNSSNTTVGNINWNASSTSYLTSSDYRLKENVVDITGATERLKQLSPKRFNFIADADTTVDGFLAHEVSSVVPEAITGTKDEVDADGNPVYQGIDQSKLVPLLVATIKELEARIEALENA